MAIDIERVIVGEVDVPLCQEARNFIGGLKARSCFAEARRLLTFLGERYGDDERAWALQQLVVCTYKDEELPTAKRLRQGLEILETKLNLRQVATTDAETLALGGAIHKRLWEHSGQLEHLHEALDFYRAANQRDWRKDRGYGGVNAAFLMDHLAARARVRAQRSGTDLASASAIESDARKLREELARQLDELAAARPEPEEDYFFIVTRAEIAFGLGQFDEAAQFLAMARNLNAGSWEVQTTFRQLVTIARLKGYPPPQEGQPLDTWGEAWCALAALLGADDAASALSCYRGKVGLALSGGGFRASLFHIGVLARLAEMDVLRSVEVLSTVSGGSIVGAHYYLEVQQLLESTPDSAVTRDDYLEIVRRLMHSFVAGVQSNLRMRALADWPTSVRLITDPTYTRSNRMGELYEEYLYSQVAERSPAATATQPVAGVPRHVAGRARSMRELAILPAVDASGNQMSDFKPLFGNWRRRAKVPQLLLNATSLNSGHLWHFTASWMGEPPGMIDPVDVNRRYRRLYYQQAPDRSLQDYRVGYAVAASACVPGLFDPLPISNLYPDRVVRLVDGGVYDNQGVAGLLNEGCSIVFCSDASGQMEDTLQPAGGLLGPLNRSSQAIFMDRIRESQFQDLQARVEASALSGLFFIHLKQDLPSVPIVWNGCADPSPPALERHTTKYNIDFTVQQQLAAVRTDLDSFTEVEAYTLMLSGYLMTEEQCLCLQAEQEKAGGSTQWGDFKIDAKRQEWPFLALEHIVDKPFDDPDPRRRDLGTQLAASQSLFFKAWQLCPEIRRSARTVGGVCVFLWLASQGFSASRILGQLGNVAIGLLAIGGAGAAIPLWNFMFPKRAVHNYVGKAASMVPAWVIAQLHLRFFDQPYLNRGRLSALLDLRPPSGTDTATPPNTESISLNLRPPGPT